MNLLNVGRLNIGINHNLSFKYSMKLTVYAFLILINLKTEAQTSVLPVSDGLIQTGKYQLALIELRSAQPQTFDILVKQGKIYQKTSNYSKAIIFYQLALEKRYSNKVYQSLGNSYLLQGNANKAIDIYEKVLEKDSLNLFLKYDLAKLYTKEFRKKDAILLLEELIEADSLNPGYYYNLGKIYHNIGPTGFMKSGNYFLDAYRIDTTHLKSIYELTKFYKKLQFKDSTSLFISKGLEVNPKSINFNQLKAKDALYKKEYDTTLVYLKKLEDLNFKNIFVYKMYGLTYLNMEDYDNAKKYFTKAYRMNHTDASIPYNLGIVSKNQGDLKNAKRYFLMSIYNLKPEVDKHYFELGLISIEENNLKEAISNFKKSYKNNPKNYLALFQLAISSDKYLKDKHIPMEYFQEYVDKFSSQDQKMSDYAVQKIKEFKKEFFLQGIKVN